jgi:O-antigen ligase
MAALLRRPAWLAAATILAVCVPTAEQNASTSVSVTPADLVAVALVAMVGLNLLRHGLPATSRLWWAFGAAALGFTVATMTAADPALSLSGLVRYLEIFVIVPAAVALSVRDHRDARVVCAAVLAAGVFEGALGVWQAVTGTGASFAGQDVRAVGTFGAVDIMGMATVVGYAIVVAVGLALRTRGRARVAMYALAAALTGPLLVSLSRGTLIATVAAGAAMVLAATTQVQLRAALVALGMAGAAVFLVWVALPPASGVAADTNVVGRFATIASATSTPDRSVQDRYDLWQTALSIWRDHPVTGIGLKGFADFRDSRAPLGLSSGSDVADTSLSFRREPLLTPHNMYLLVLSEQGIVGAAGFVGLFAAVGVRALRRTRATRTTADPDHLLGPAAVGILVWTLVNFTVGDIGGPTTVLLSVLFGLSASWALPEPVRQRVPVEVA